MCISLKKKKKQRHPFPLFLINPFLVTSLCLRDKHGSTLMCVNSDQPRLWKCASVCAKSQLLAWSSSSGSDTPVADLPAHQSSCPASTLCVSTVYNIKIRLTTDVLTLHSAIINLRSECSYCSCDKVGSCCLAWLLQLSIKFYLKAPKQVCLQATVSFTLSEADWSCHTQTSWKHIRLELWDFSLKGLSPLPHFVQCTSKADKTSVPRLPSRGLERFRLWWEHDPSSIWPNCWNN